MANKIIRRKDALRQGLIRYFTGKPCKNSGHVAERFTVNGDCVACSPAKSKRLSWWKKNPERHREHGYKARRKLGYRQWREEYVRKNFIWINKQKRNWWYAQSLEKRRAIKLAHRYKFTDGKHTFDEFLVILKEQKYRCVYCSTNLKKIKPHLEHKIPVCRGGSNSRRNLHFTCGLCNLRKGKLTHREFLIRENLNG